MTGAVVFMTLGMMMILAIYSLIDRWMDIRADVIEQEAERMRIENETAELILESRKKEFYDKSEIDQ